MFSCFVIRQEREWGIWENPFLVVIAHVHLRNWICFTERPRQWVLCFKTGALKLPVVFSQTDPKPAFLDRFLLQTLYNSTSYLGLRYMSLVWLIAYLLTDAFLYEKVILQVTSKVNKKKGSPYLAFWSYFRMKKEGCNIQGGNEFDLCWRVKCINIRLKQMKHFLLHHHLSCTIILWDKRYRY